MKLIAIHEIEYCTAKGKRQYARPGHMFEIDDDAAARLKKMGSARDPSEAELALEALKGGKRKVTKESEEQPKRRGRRRKSDDDDEAKEDDVV